MEEFGVKNLSYGALHISISWTV